MRRIAVLLLAFCLSSQAAEVLIPVRLERLPDPEIEKAIAGFKAPLRKLAVPAEWGTQLADSHPISVRGEVSDSELRVLLAKASFERQRALRLNEKVSWRVEVIVVGAFAKVMYSHDCGMLCGFGVDLVFRRVSSGWVFHYKASEWVS